jgi:hypothetical protein
VIVVANLGWQAASVPNKSMVPTAPVSPTADPPRPLRRHIGQPLDAGAKGGAKAQ